MKSVGWYLLLLYISAARLFLAESEYQKMQKDYQQALFDKVVNVQGEVLEINSQSPAFSQFVIRDTRNGAHVWANCRSLPLLIVGQAVIIKGKIEPLQEIENNGFKNYLKLKQVLALIKASNCAVENEYYFNSRYLIARVRVKLMRLITSHFQGDTAGLLAGLLIGDTDLLSESTKKSFISTGLAHVMAISGANMTMLVGLVFAFTVSLPLRTRIVIAVLFLTIFVFMVGLSGGVIRAYMMSLVGLVAMFFNKPYLSSRAVWAVIVGVFMWNPFVVLYDIGFQLSIAATSGIIAGLAITKKTFPSKIVQVLVSHGILTLSATLATTPLLVYYFGRLSLLALPINLVFALLFAVVGLVGYVVLLLIALPGIAGIVEVGFSGISAVIIFVVSYMAAVAEGFNYELSLSWEGCVGIYLFFSVLYFVFRYVNR